MQIDKIIHSKRKTLGLQITGDGELIVRAPKRISKKTIEEFVQSKSKWIAEKQQEAKKRHAQKIKLTFQDGAQIPFLGELYPIQLVTNRQKLCFSKNHFLFPKKHINQGEKIFAAWCKLQIKKYLASLINNYCITFKLEYSTIRIGSGKKTLGSCNNRKGLNFSWRVITLPPQIIEYIAVHELAHLKYLDHSKNFWHQVAKMLPNYKDHKRWLLNNRQRIVD